MKALVLAGGAGTRLRPITHTNAKQLVPLANKPILFYGIEAIAAAGIREVGIIVGDARADIEAAVGDGSRWGVAVTYLHQDSPRGLAHAVVVARDFLGDEPFVMYLGDNLVVGGIEAFVEEFDRRPTDAQVLLAKVDHPEHFGVAELDAGGNLVSLVEKPEHPTSDLALVGVYLFGPVIHDAVAAIEPSARGELEITDAIQWLLDAGHAVRSRLVEGPWIDTGKLQELLEANRIVLDRIAHEVRGTIDESSSVSGVVVLEEGVEVVRSVLEGPLALGPGTRVVDSRVGPYSSIAGDCLISDAEIEHSVVLEGCHIVGVRRVEGSLVGRETRVIGTGAAVGIFRLVLGDHSEIQVS